jgi:RNA 3'-terminal phosphate cyclase
MGFYFEVVKKHMQTQTIKLQTCFNSGNARARKFTQHLPTILKIVENDLPG